MDRAAVALGLVLALASAARADGFVAVDGAQLVLDGKPFRFVGANVEVLHGAAYRRGLAATLDAARADGLTVVRVWALGEGPADAPAWRRESELFRAGPDGFLDGAYAQLDRALAAARARGLKVIVTLANQWGDFGGVPEYLRWAGLPGEGWAARDAFYADPRVRALYRAHLDRLVARYANDPTILAWELMNESQVDSPAGAAARRAWVDEMAGAIRARDPRHLVTPGLMGYGTRAERAEWLAVCTLPSVSYCDSHLYPQTTDESGSLAELEAFLDDRVQLAQFVAKKPLVVGEFGFDTRPERASWLGRPRADWFAALLARAHTDGAAGALAWIYQPWMGRARDFGIYVDRPDTDDVRAALRAAALALRGPAPPPNPRLGAEKGDALLYDPYRTLHRDAPALLSADGRQVTLSHAHFATAHFQRAGFYAGTDHPHAYGAFDGWFEWRFPAPAAPIRALTITLRASSEFPGSSAPPDGTSTVRVLIDGALAGSATVIPDDGQGAEVRLRVTDRAIRRSLPGRAHVLRLEVPPGAPGLCLYAPVRLDFE